MVTELLEAAMAAPSARHEEPCHFIVMRDHKIMDEIPNYHPFSKMLPEAPVAILVCADTTTIPDNYWIQDASAAMENILIAARAKGLGAVWLGVYPNEERFKNVQKLCGIPEKVIPVGIISIGWPDEQKPPADRFKQERIHKDRW